MHALIVNGIVVQYPYTIGMLRRDNPNTSFPKRPSDDLLARWDMQIVAKSDCPSADHTKNIVEGEPVRVDGVWTQVWEIADATAEEIAERNERAATSVRDQRNALLTESDWTQVADAPVDAAAWATYRQALRDITAQEGFPYNVTWPTKPE